MRAKWRWARYYSPRSWPRCWRASRSLPGLRISDQLDRISAGQFDVEPVHQTDELGQVSTKISNIGKQLRDVREVFSTLRENLNHVMAGLEDGLMLFNADGRAVLISPSIEKFLGIEPATILGRRACEIFPQGNFWSATFCI